MSVGSELHLGQVARPDGHATLQLRQTLPGAVGAGGGEERDGVGVGVLDGQRDVALGGGDDDDAVRGGVGVCVEGPAVGVLGEGGGGGEEDEGGGREDGG